MAASPGKDALFRSVAITICNVCGGCTTRVGPRAGCGQAGSGSGSDRVPGVDDRHHMDSDGTSWIMSHDFVVDNVVRDTLRAPVVSRRTVPTNSRRTRTAAGLNNHIPDGP